MAKHEVKKHSINGHYNRFLTSHNQLDKNKCCLGQKSIDDLCLLLRTGSCTNDESNLHKYTKIFYNSTQKGLQEVGKTSGKIMINQYIYLLTFLLLSLAFLYQKMKIVKFTFSLQFNLVNHLCT